MIDKNFTKNPTTNKIVFYLLVADFVFIAIDLIFKYFTFEYPL